MGRAGYPRGVFDEGARFARSTFAEGEGARHSEIYKHKFRCCGWEGRGRRWSEIAERGSSFLELCLVIERRGCEASSPAPPLEEPHAPRCHN
jgi:hypothetical protein